MVSFTFPLSQFDSQFKTLALLTECPVAPQWCHTPTAVCQGLSVQPEWSGCVTIVCVAAVIVAHDVVDGSTLVFFRCLSFGCTTTGRRVLCSK